MSIIPAWMIKELKDLREEQENILPRLYIEIPIDEVFNEGLEKQAEEEAESIYISLR